MAKLLHWYPFEPAKWRALTGALTPEALGAFVELRCCAWEAISRNQPPCCLPDDDAALARMSKLHSRWKYVAQHIRALLTTTADGYLRDEDLYATWAQQHAGYQRRAEAGAKGGKGKGKRPLSDSNASAKQRELELEGVVTPAPTEPGVTNSPASADALAPDGARAVDAVTNGDYLDRPSVRDELLRRGVRPEQIDAQSRDARTLAEVAADSLELARRHGLALKAAADAWMAANPEETRAIGREVRRDIGVGADVPVRELSPFARDRLTQAVLVTIAERNRWPMRPDAWDGEPFAITAPAGAAP